MENPSNYTEEGYLDEVLPSSSKKWTRGQPRSGQSVAVLLMLAVSMAMFFATWAIKGQAPIESGLMAIGLVCLVAFLKWIEPRVRLMAARHQED